MSGSATAAPASARLARAVAATHWRDLPARVRAQAADIFLDTLAVIAAAAAESDHSRWIDSLAAEPGPCTLIGFDARVPARTAATGNAGATTVLQWQDGHRRARGHPASHLVPALLALAEPRDLRGDAVMTAFVAGYECAARVGLALGGLQQGLHDAGTWPTLGTAAACVRLLGGEATTIAAAIEGAACIAPQPFRETARRGDGIHHLYMAVGVSAALEAANASLAGLGSPPSALEEFFGVRAGAAFDAAMLTDGIGADDRWSRFEILDAYFKWHPVCAHFSGVADALTALVADGEPAPTLDAVAAVEVATYATGLDYQNADPHTPLAARFSIPAIVYAALAPGGLRGDALAKIASPDCPDRAWLRRVTVVHDPTLDAGYPAGRPARVTLQFVDGSRRTATVTDVYGDSARPLSAAARTEKVQAALARRLGKAGAARAVAAFGAFVEDGTISALMSTLRPGG